MDGEIWLEIADVAVAVGVTTRAIRKRIRFFTTRLVKGKGGASGARYQLLLSSLPESWQTAYWARLNALPLSWQDAVRAKALPAPLPDLLPAPPSPLVGAGSIAPVIPPPGAVALSSSCGGEDSAAPVVPMPGAVALSSPATGTALVPAVPDDDTTYIKEWQRDCLYARLALLQELDRRRLGHHLEMTMAFFCDAIKHGELPPELQALVPVAVAKNKSISPRTLRRWLAARDAGLIYLAPGKKGSHPRIPAWGNALLKEWRRPQKPSLPFVLEQLAQPGKLPPGVPVPSASSARRFLKMLDVIERNRGRLGPRALKNLRPYRQRDASGLWPLEVVSMDGHTFDAEVAHPFHGQPFRPEITSIIDISTRKLVGWSVALAESALAVLDALRHAVQTHGIPAILYVDNGSGYKNTLLEQQAIGFLARLGIEKTHSRPFNSQARGVIERLHRTVWVSLAKTLPTYLGDDMDQEARNRVYKLTRADLKIARKAARISPLLPAWPDFLAACERAVAEYNARPHSSLPLIRDPATGVKRHQSPDEVWAELVQQNPDCQITVAETELADLFRPYRVGKVTRGCVRIFGNVYYHTDLAAYHGDTVFIGYDLHDAGQVWIRDRNQRLICVAALDGNRSDYIGQTALEYAHVQRAKARQDRLERHLEEVHLELHGSRPVLEGRLATPAEIAAADAELAALQPPAPAPDSAERPRFRSDLELWRWVEANPDRATEQDRVYLATCLEDENFRELIEIERQKKSRPMNRVA